MTDDERAMIEQYVEQAKQPNRSFDLTEVTRLLAIRIGDARRAARMVRAWDHEHTLKATPQTLGMTEELPRRWQTPEYHNCKTAREVLARRAKLARH
jgi:hypothetical protein